MQGAGPDLWGSAFEAFTEGVKSTGKKVAAGLTAVAVASSGPGRRVLQWGTVQVAKGLDRAIQDPIGTARRQQRILKTYRLAGQAAAGYRGLSRFWEKNESSSSSTSSYQQYGGGGDTLSVAEKALAVGYLAHQAHGFMTEKSYPKHPAMSCRPGFVEKRIKGKLMCVRIKHKRK